MTAAKTALVIGAGIAGPTTAIALHKAGIHATVYEAYDTSADNVGGGFNLATNGLDGLAAVDALDAVRDLGIPAPRLALHNGSGRLLGTLATGLPLPDGTNTTSFRRADLYRALRAEATRRGVVTEHGKRLVSVEQDRHQVTAHFADRTQAAADVLIGADGIYSTVRGLIDPDAPTPRYTGLVSFGGFAPNPGLPALPDTWTMVFGRRAFLGYFIPDTTQVWWFVNVPSREPRSRDQILADGIDTWSRRLTELFRDDRTPIDQILRAQGDGIICLGAQYDLPRVPRWHHGRLVLVGDAAHAASTSSGQGASMAIESAVTLARCLRDHPTPTEAFHAYDGLRRNRVERIIAYGAKSAASKAAGPFAALVRDTFMTIGLRLVYKPTSDAWLLRHHIDWNASASQQPAASH
jgi:FAD-dependent urate hydroxylase